MAQVLIKEPRILVFDEPTGTMDPVTKIEVAKSILNARRELGETFIIVSHDMDFVAQVCDRAALMRLGKIVDIGDTDTVLSKLSEKEREETLEGIVKELK
jgi:methyl coenzyme M reductase system subunit A2